jgi:hypothetical protein
LVIPNHPWSNTALSNAWSSAANTKRIALGGGALIAYPDGPGQDEVGEKSHQASYPPLGLESLKVRATLFTCPVHAMLGVLVLTNQTSSVPCGAPAGPVDLDRYPLRGGLRSDQLERYVRAGVGEQPRPLADDHGEGEQVHLVDEVVVEQPPEQDAAAVYLQLASGPGFQLANASRDVFGEDGRVRPLRVEGSGRCHVLEPRVQRRPDRAVARIVPSSPGVGEDFVGAPAEQERVGALVDLVHDRSSFVVEVGPSAALEYAALVLLRPARPLHHSVNGDLRSGC